MSHFEREEERSTFLFSSPSLLLAAALAVAAQLRPPYGR